MANLIIKPTSGGSLILQDEGGDAALTVGATGSTTLAGTANALGTVTAGTLGSTVVFPAGHILGYAGQYEGAAMGSSVTNTTAAGDVLNSGITITIGSGNKSLVLMTGWFYTEINHANADRHVALYKNVNSGGDVEVDEVWQGGENMKQYERMAISAMVWDNTVGSVVYKLKVKTLGAAGNVRYYSNMFAFEIKG